MTDRVTSLGYVFLIMENKITEFLIKESFSIAPPPQTSIVEKFMRFYLLFNLNESNRDDDLLLAREREEIIERIRVPIISYQCNEAKFYELFGIRRSTYLKIVNVVSASGVATTRAERGRCPIPLEKKCLMAIFYLSSQQSIKEIAERFSVCQWSVYEAINLLIASLLGISSSIIFWPPVREFPAIAGRFQKISARPPYRKGFPGVVGAIDRCKIPCLLKRVAIKENLQQKMYVSIRLEAVCDPECLFTELSVGSEDDTADLYLSNFNENCVPDEFHLIGNSGYNLSERMMVPYRDTGTLTTFESSYNTTHSRARIKIVEAFGMLLGRWKRLQMINIKTITKGKKIIMACCILHNLCLREGDVCENIEAPVADWDEQDGTEKPSPAAVSKRNRIKHNLSRI